MKCPICGNELRPSKKDPAYGLCDNCKKKFKLTKKENNLLLITLYRDLFFRILQT